MKCWTAAGRCCIVTTDADDAADDDSNDEDENAEVLNRCWETDRLP